MLRALCAFLLAAQVQALRGPSLLPRASPRGLGQERRVRRVRAAPMCSLPTLALSAAPLMESSSALMQGAFDSTFLQATSLIFLSEIGDKTFFIARRRRRPPPSRARDLWKRVF